jgi:hypothetical protein
MHRDKVEVELYDRPGFRFWFAAADVRIGAPRPRPTMMSARHAGQRKGPTIEVRAVCRHVNLAAVCRECGGREPEARGVALR